MSESVFSASGDEQEKGGVGGGNEGQGTPQTASFSSGREGDLRLPRSAQACGNVRRSKWGPKSQRARGDDPLPASTSVTRERDHDTPFFIVTKYTNRLVYRCSRLKRTARPRQPPAARGPRLPRLTPCPCEAALRAPPPAPGPGFHSVLRR